MPELIRGRLLEAPAAPGRASQGLGELTPGRVLKATVVGPQEGGLTLIRLGSQSLLAETSLPLSPGQALTLTVQHGGPPLVLALLEEPPAPASPLPGLLQELTRGRQRFSQDLATLLKLDPQSLPSPRAGELVRRLQDLLGQMLLRGQSPVADGQTLARLPGLSGLDLEARLAQLAQANPGGQGGQALPESLRSLLPEVLRELASLLPGLARQQPELLAALRQFMAAGQGLSQFGEQAARLNAELTPQALFFLGLPLAWAESWRSGELLITLPQPEAGGDQEEEPGLRLVIFLDLAALGPLLMEVSLRGAELWGLVLTDTPDKARFLEERLAPLGQGLEELGLRVRLAARCRAPEEPAEPSPLAELLRRQGSQLSLKV